MRYGVFGGTFDPPHRGHLALALAAQRELQLDGVIFVPAARNPFKLEKRSGASATKRFEMTKLLIQDHPGLMATDVEITRGGPSYMVDTLEELQIAMPGEYWLLIGADNLQRFMEWKSAERILRTTRIGVTTRPGSDVDALVKAQGDLVRPRLDIIPMEPMDISATEIRNRLVNGKDASTLLTPEVAEYIREKRLYQEHARN